MSTIELQFLREVAQHERLQKDTALQLIDLVLYVYLNQPLIAKVLLEPMLDLIERNRREKEFVTFVELALVPQACSQILSIKKDEFQNII